MYTELYNENDHLVVLFHGLVKGDGVQTNQLLIKNGEHSAIFDPGGNLTFMPLNIAINKYEAIKKLEYVVATHQDPDVISSLQLWIEQTDANIVISRLWTRFLTHLIPGYMEDIVHNGDHPRLISIPDNGLELQLGEAIVKAVPAHFLHSAGNFHFYDETSKILFSGDVGASLSDANAGDPVTNLEDHIGKMLDFHQRYMASNKVCRLWVEMVREMDIEMIVPQHGKIFRGKKMINDFLIWFSHLQCGVDLMTNDHYKLT